MDPKYDKLFLIAGVLALIVLALRCYNWFVDGEGGWGELAPPLILAAFMLYLWSQRRKRGAKNG